MHKPTYRLGRLTIGILLSLAWTTPGLTQTKWFKYEGNPVLDVGAKDHWDDIFAIAHRIIARKAKLQMWYGGLHAGQARMGYATSLDGVKWNKYQSNPVLDLSEMEWDSVKAYYGYVVFTGSQYEMWYVGGPGVQVRIGYATSPDGVHWTKAKNINPIVDFDTSRVWHKVGFASPSVWGPDSAGVLRMWYHAIPASGLGIQVGYASARIATSWIRYPDPVLTLGPRGAWDQHRVGYPRVLHDGDSYKMWYSGSRETNETFRVGLATSLDGIHWIKSAENPVLKAGPPGSWDDSGVWTGDVMFDGFLYHMWYVGHDGSKGQTGYAVSPKGINTAISPSNSYISPGSLVRIAVKADRSHGLLFSAAVKAPIRGQYFPGLIGQAELQVVEDIPLYDDGAHEDGLAGDGFFASSWSPKEENIFVVDIRLRLRQRKDTLRFVMENAGAFTNVGPIRFESFQFVGNKVPNPGDTVIVKLALRNQGALATPTSISASLSTVDSFVTDMSSVAPEYGSISAGGIATTSGYYRLFINPRCPSDHDIRINVLISSLGTGFWHDTMTLHVSAAWWRNGWAYFLYAVLVVGLAGGTIRYTEIRKLRRRIEKLEREQALERERARISRDMHDDVGARLTEIGILSELAKKAVEDPRQMETQLQKISETSREVTANIGEIIWAIDTRNDSLDDLIAYLRHYASKYLRTNAIQCVFDVPEKTPTLRLSAEIRRNIFLVVKETLHNVVKHSKATVVRMLISFLDHKIKIEIEDNGQGFDTCIPSRFGNGLRNMEKRMSDAGGTFVIWSRSGQGTKVTLEC